MKKLALLVYPNFSLQEVMNLSSLFLWHYEIATEVLSTSLDPVKSEEGIVVLPQATTDQFRTCDYQCLILPGCSDFTQLCQDQKLISFLQGFQGNSDFPIGAICGGPMLLARAGLLRGRPFTASIYREYFDICPFLEREHFVAAPAVVSPPIVTAGGGNFNGFAVEMARLLGLPCRDRIFDGYMDQFTQDYLPHLPPEALAEMTELLGNW